MVYNYSQDEFRDLFSDLKSEFHKAGSNTILLSRLERRIKEILRTNGMSDLRLPELRSYSKSYYTYFYALYTLNKSKFNSNNPNSTSTLQYSTRQNYMSNPSSTNRNVSNTKSNGVSSQYNDLINVISTAIDRYNYITFDNKDLESVRLQFVNKLNEYKREVRSEIEYLNNSVVWDRLVIAFFGETNAGKSTIIESLRIILGEESRSKQLRNSATGVDGCIVGDGRHDYTQDYNEYNLKVDGIPFTLIDVPGIEGNEKVFKDGINKALRKAHIVFYVHGKSKDTDVATASKIKEYLQDWVKVCILYNIRGNSDQYEFPEDRRALITTNIQKVKDSLSASFERLIGNNFDSVVPVQGLMAMASHASFSPNRQDLIKLQHRLFEYFKEDTNGNLNDAKKRIERFSNVSAVLDYIKSKSRNFRTEIENSNRRKLVSMVRKHINALEALVNQEKDKIDRYDTRISNAIKSNRNIAETTGIQIANASRILLTQGINSFRKDVIDAVNKEDFQTITILQNRFCRKLDEAIHNEIRSRLDEFRSRLNSSIAYLLDIPGIRSIDARTNINFNFNKLTFSSKDISEANDISGGDVMKAIGGTAGGATTGAIIGSFFGPIGTIIGGAIGGIGGLVSGNVSAADAQYERARKAANEKIDNFERNLKSELDVKLNEVKRQLDNNAASINSKLQSTKNNLERFNNVNLQSKRDLSNFINYNTNN